MPRTMLSDVNWESLAKLMKATGRVYNKCEHRLTLEGIFYRMRTGCPWRDLPSEFGRWHTVFRRFNLWSRKGVMAQLFKALSQDTDLEWVFLDASYVRAHQHGHGAATPGDEAIGKSRGGNTTKIHLAVDSYGLPVHFELSAGQVSDISRAESLLDGTPVSEYVIADKGYDSDAVIRQARSQGMQAQIPPRKNRKKPRDYDKHLYR